MDKNEILTERRAVRLGERQDEIMRYLARVSYDAGERTRRILPEVADVQAHPLPALQDLSAAVSEPRTLGDICDELAAYLADETRLAVAGRMRGLDALLTFYAASLAPTLRDLLTAKIQTCQTLGNAAAREKLETAARTLPDFATPADLEAHIVTGVRATEKLVAAWRNGQPCAFPAPDKFRVAFRRALMMDAEGTRLANGCGLDEHAERFERIEKKLDQNTAITKDLAEELTTWREWVQKLATNPKTKTPAPPLCAQMQTAIVRLWETFNAQPADCEDTTEPSGWRTHKRTYNECLHLHGNDDIWHGQKLIDLTPDAKALERVIHNAKEKKRQKKAAASATQARRKK